MERENIMGTLDVRRLVLKTGFPLMLSLLINSLYYFVDGIFVSTVSENALTGVSLSSPMQNLINALGCCNAIGLNAVISRALGQKDREEVRRTASAAIWLAFFSGCSCCCAVCFW